MPITEPFRGRSIAEGDCTEVLLDLPVDSIPNGFQEELDMPYLSPSTLTVSEVQVLLRASSAHPRDNLILSVALGTGLRLGEITGLDVGDLFFPDGTPRQRVRVRAEIAKGGAGLARPVTPGNCCGAPFSPVLRPGDPGDSGAVADPFHGPAALGSRDFSSLSAL